MKSVVAGLKKKKKETCEIRCQMVSLKLKAFTDLRWNKSVEDNDI